MDVFDRIFAHYFYGIELPRVTEGDPELLRTEEFRRWLEQAIEKCHRRRRLNDVLRELAAIRWLSDRGIAVFLIARLVIRMGGWVRKWLSAEVRKGPANGWQFRCLPNE